MILFDDFTRIMWVAFLREKYETFDKFKVFKNRVKNEFGLKIKCLGLDRGGEFTLNEIKSFCEENGMKRHISAPKTPEKNGVVERRKKPMTKATRAMMFENNVSNTF